MLLGDAGCGIQQIENPRVGGSTLATIQIKVSNQEVASGRVDSLSNIGADVQYFGPLFA
jgi:hypothetical protein